MRFSMYILLAVLALFAAACQTARAQEVAELAAVEKAGAEKIAVEKVAGEKITVEKAAVEKSAGEKSSEEKGSSEKIGGEKITVEKVAGQKITDKQAPGDKTGVEKTAAEKIGAEKVAPEKFGAEKSAGQKSGRESCPATQAPVPPFVPPQPWPAQPPGDDQFWYGDAGLWTALPASGSWPQLARGEKFWWWSDRFDVKADSTPDLELSARPLDGKWESVKVAQATNGYHASFHWAMLAGIDLPGTGCWEITARYKGQSLTVTVWVPEE